MRPVSSDFLDLLRGPHRMVARATLVDTFQTGTSPAGTVLPILGGNVQLDASAQVRSTLDLTTEGTAWSTKPTAPITPYGNEVFIERGVVLGTGSAEYVSLGYFKIYDVDQDEAPDGPLRLSGRDRMASIIDAKLEAPIQFAASTTVFAVFDRLVREVYPAAVIEFDFDANTQAIGRTTVVEDERYDYLQEVATAFGKVMFFDHAGKLQVRTPPTPTAPVWTVDAGQHGVLVQLSRGLSRDGVYNAVIMEGEGADSNTPVRAVARDTGRTSPTYYYGKFGKVPTRESLPQIRTTAQAATAAMVRLSQVIGLPHSADFTAVPNPALEPLDPIRLDYSERASTEVHVIESLTVGLSAGDAMTGTTRDQTTVQIEVTV